MVQNMPLAPSAPHIIKFKLSKIIFDKLNVFYGCKITKNTQNTTF